MQFNIMMKWVMEMSNERTPYLQELMRLSSEATLLIPSIVFNEELFVNGNDVLVLNNSLS